MKTTIKVNWSASEMEPWTSEIDVIGYNSYNAVITCKSNDSRLRKKIEIPADMEYYDANGDYIIYRGYEMIAWINYNDAIHVALEYEKLNKIA